MPKILVVDDDRLTRMMLNDALSDAGHQVIEADDGSLVEGLIKQESPHILITDIMMQKQEGIETIIQMKEKYPFLPIIAISGNKEYLSVAEILGVNAIMPKPIDEDALIQKVNELSDAL